MYFQHLSLWSSVPTNPTQDLVQLDQNFLLFLDSLEPLRLGHFELLLQILDQLLLVALAVVKSWKARDEVFHLLLLENQVARELDHACLEDIGREGVD